MADLNNLRVAIIATDGFEESELTEPARVLQEAGAQVEIVSLKSGEIQAFRHHDKGTTVKVDKTLEEVKPDDYDALQLPGGALNADALRLEPKVKAFVKAFQEAGKPMAIICHAAWRVCKIDCVRRENITSETCLQTQ